MPGEGAGQASLLLGCVLVVSLLTVLTGFSVGLFLLPAALPAWLTLWLATSADSR